jgi:acetylornithine deacetylase/succinyl-diaminopimelate desuccinylase-like protein
MAEPDGDNPAERACEGRRASANTGMPSPSTKRIHASLEPARARLVARDAAILRTQVALTEIPAPTGDEGQRGRWVANRFRALGLADIHSDAAGNVIGWRDSDRTRGTRDCSPVVVCAHLDTVFPVETSLRVARDGTRLIGPGIGDNGRGLAAMLALAEEIDGERLRPGRPIQFVATTGEEGAGDLRGVKHLFRSGTPAAAVIALDGAGDDRVVNRALGSRRFRIVFRGAGGHSWAAYGLPNAVHAAGSLTARIASFAMPRCPRTTLSVCRIGGGLSVNSIPRDAWVEIDLRSTSQAVIGRVDMEIRALAHAAADEENGRRTPGTEPLSVAIDVIGDRPCGETPADHPLVSLAMEATRCIEREPELTVASTDANVPISRGIPAIAIGAGGRGGDAHSPAEWFDNAEGPLGIGRALTIVMGAATLAM